MTERQTEINLATSFASALLEASPDGVLVIDRDYRVVNCNNSPLINGGTDSQTIAVTFNSLRGPRGWCYLDLWVNGTNWTEPDVDWTLGGDSATVARTFGNNTAFDLNLETNGATRINIESGGHVTMSADSYHRRYSGVEVNGAADNGAFTANTWSTGGHTSVIDLFKSNNSTPGTHALVTNDMALGFYNFLGFVFRF